MDNFHNKYVFNMVEYEAKFSLADDTYFLDGDRTFNMI